MRNSFSLGLVVNLARPGALELLGEVRRWAGAKHADLVLGDVGFGYPPGDEKKLPVTEMSGFCDAVLVIGGDGTILRAAPLVAPLAIPLVAVNTGDFGFLATAESEEIEDLLEELLAGSLREESRCLLDAHFDATHGSRDVLALNDIVMHRGEEAKIVKLQVMVGDELVSRFAADGVIVSTPTGSTAYSLSAGGPVFHPGVDALAITPLCAHTLAMRPAVVSGNAKITLKVLAYEGGDVLVLADGQVVANLGIGDEVIVERSQHRVRLLLRKERSFYQVLRAKLGWAGARDFGEI